MNLRMPPLRALATFLARPRQLIALCGVAAIFAAVAAPTETVLYAFYSQSNSLRRRVRMIKDASRTESEWIAMVWQGFKRQWPFQFSGGRGWRPLPLINRRWLILSVVSLLFFYCAIDATLAATCVAPPSGMIAWWTLDETSGIIAQDSVGAEPAAYFGNPAPVPATGEVAGALKFNGANDFLGAPQSSIWGFGTSDFTIELWANFSAPGGGSIGHPGDIFIGADEGPSNRNKWFFALGGGYLEFHINSPTLGPQFFPLVPFSPTVGVWYHLAVVRSGNTYTIYINGTPAGSATNTNAIPSPNAPLTIGQAESLGFVNGFLDEITVYNRALSPAELASIVAAGGAGKCKIATASAITPSVGGDAGQVTVTISGSGFNSASTVTLSKSGLSDITGSAPIVSADGKSLTTTFDLTGQPDGARDVVISTPSLPTVTLSGAFTIEPARPPNQVWADIVGRGAILIGKTQEFTLLYGNRGDVDAINVPIWMTGIPTTATFIPQFTLTEPDTVPGYPPFDSSIPITIATGSDLQVPLLINRIPPGAVVALKFSLSVVDTAPITLKATVYPPIGSPVADLSLARSMTALSSGTEASQCLGDIVQQALAVLDVTETAECAKNTAAAVLTTLSSFASVLNGDNKVAPILDFTTSWVERALVCCGIVAPPSIKLILAATEQALAAHGIFVDCTPVFAKIIYQGILNVVAVFTRDPNTKQGSQGLGTLHYLTGSQPWPYVVAFENEATATAPVQFVSVTDQLDTTRLDLTTFSLGPMGFGDQEIVPPPGLSEFSTYVDLQPATNLIVAVNASLDKATGIVTWTFQGLDPSTGQPPTDPTIGFLPPDVNPPQGDGQVLFSVSPKSGLSSGQQINNSASVVFDANPAVVTPVWSNMLLPPIVPTSQVATTASGLAYSRVTRTFNGTVTLTNISGSPVSGPLQIVFTGLTSGVTLVNATGNLSGPPYLTVPGVTSLAPGQSTTLKVLFSNPANATINFIPEIYSGSF